MAAFALAVAAIWAAATHRAPGVTVAAPVVGFVVLVVVHDRADRARKRALRAVDYWERGLARIEERWVGHGEGGARFYDDAHPYARDLDLFGKGSLFELLVHRAHALGRGDAGALAAGARRRRREVRARQEAVKELRERLDLREELALAGEDVRAEVDPQGLSRWGAARAAAGAQRRLARRRRAVACRRGRAERLVRAALERRCRSLCRPAGGGAGDARLSRPRRGRARRRRSPRARSGGAGAGGRPVRERALRQRPRLRALAAIGCATATRPASHADRAAGAPGRLGQRAAQPVLRADRLARPVAGALRLRHRRLARRAPAPTSRAGSRSSARSRRSAALAGYAYERPDEPFPEIVDDGPRVEAEALGHPLIPRGRCVRNDLALGGELRLLVVSGSNMSGKTTMLRTVGINVVLALAGAPVRATQR